MLSNLPGRLAYANSRTRASAFRDDARKQRRLALAWVLITKQSIIFIESASPASARASTWWSLVAAQQICVACRIYIYTLGNSAQNAREFAITTWTRIWKWRHSGRAQLCTGGTIYIYIPKNGLRTIFKSYTLIRLGKHIYIVIPQTLRAQPNKTADKQIFETLPSSFDTMHKTFLITLCAILS